MYKSSRSIPGEHVPSNQKKVSIRLKEIIFMTIGQILMIIFYATFTTYGIDVEASSTTTKSTILNYYPMYMDIHTMMFLGIGFIMTFLKYNGWSSVMFNMLTAVWCMQWGILCVTFFHQLFENEWHKIELDITYLIEGDFATGTVLVSYGAILGKVNSFQCLMMGTIEVIFYALNYGICQKIFHAIDMGGSMYLHLFGGYFGLACAWALGPRDMKKKNVNIGSNYHSYLFSAFGCMFLFMLWPSFNGVLAQGNSQHRVVINTVLA